MNIIIKILIALFLFFFVIVPIITWAMPKIIPIILDLIGEIGKVFGG